MTKLRKTFFLIIALCFFSCYQSLDFDQLEDYVITPSYTTALATFSINALALTSPPATEITEKTNFEIFKNTFFRDYSVRLDFEFEIINEINRDFVLEITLLDENDFEIYQLQDLNISANERDFEQKEIIDIIVNPNVKDFTRVEILLRLQDPTIPISTLDNGTIKLKSAATIYLEKSL
ncbi:hypothetical protein JL193_12580 [Polaribacter batillariae]|uniref:Lipoprotein n=1 Tax=Polaribacter batillariae TaxID=2808900 RepID=A0ABX7SS35_9FLAO|nr:hypothetical protein [Polaribacter batillariae]QTD36956.1 hypothetical protein JL193_12580 [Polaribacter batillariae]